jgi:hypothetical protein
LVLNLLEISLASRYETYNIIIRLWTSCFYHLLKNLRRSALMTLSQQVRKPAPKSSGNYASVSSVSSYAQSVVSSNFTLLSGTTDESSAPSSLFDHKPRDEPKTNNAFSNQLKKLYRDIFHLETKLLADSGEPQDENRKLLSLRVAHQSELMTRRKRDGRA